MIKHELAKQLKDAGFPQKETQSCEDIEEMSAWENYMITRNLEGKHGTFDSSIAGYKETEPDFFEQGKWRPSARFKREYLNSEEGKRLTVYSPTLSELIEACGDDFDELDRNDKQSWVAENHKKGWAFVGYTPEEAVAKLWLKLNK